MAKQSTLVTAPTTVRIVTGAEIARTGRIDAPEEDPTINRMSDQAQQWVETHTGRKMFLETRDDYHDGFTSVLSLSHQPVESLTSVTYVDSNGDTQTLSTDVYELGECDGIGVVQLKYGQTWPTAQSHTNVVTVRYVCGYAEDEVPEALIGAIHIHAMHNYTYREGEVPLPRNLRDAISPYVIRGTQVSGA